MGGRGKTVGGVKGGKRLEKERSEGDKEGTLRRRGKRGKRRVEGKV